jgi:hypothetical protein
MKMSLKSEKQGRSSTTDFIREALSHGQKGSMQGALEWPSQNPSVNVQNLIFFNKLLFGFVIDLYTQKTIFTSAVFISDL